MQVHQLPSINRAFDVGSHYVRFKALRQDGFVEFDFSIGEPGLTVELVLLLKDYQEFCRTQNVVYLTREEGLTLDNEQMKWRFGQPGLKE